MAIDFQFWNRIFLAQSPYNDAHWFGVDFNYHEKPSHPVLGVHRFNDGEITNDQSRQMWVAVLDRQGNPVANKYVAGYQRRGGNVTCYLHLGDKPGLFNMSPGQEYTTWLADKLYNRLSQEIHGLVSYVGERDPEDQVYNPSYYIVFQESDDE